MDLCTSRCLCDNDCSKSSLQTRATCSYLHGPLGCNYTYWAGTITAKEINSRAKKKSTVTSTTGILGLVWIYRPGEQMGREIVTIQCSKGVCEQGCGRGQWRLTNLCHHYRRSMCKGGNQCQKDEQHCLSWDQIN